MITIVVIVIVLVVVCVHFWFYQVQVPGVLVPPKTRVQKTRHLHILFYKNLAFVHFIVQTSRHLFLACVQENAEK